MRTSNTQRFRFTQAQLPLNSTSLSITNTGSKVSLYTAQLHPQMFSCTSDCSIPSFTPTASCQQFPKYEHPATISGVPVTDNRLADAGTKDNQRYVGEDRHDPRGAERASAKENRASATQMGRRAPAATCCHTCTENTKAGQRRSLSAQRQSGMSYVPINFLHLATRSPLTICPGSDEAKSCQNEGKAPDQVSLELRARQ